MFRRSSRAICFKEGSKKGEIEMFRHTEFHEALLAHIDG